MSSQNYLGLFHGRKYLAASNLTPRIRSSISEGLFSRLNETAYILALKAGFKLVLMAQTLAQQREFGKVTERGRKLIRRLVQPGWDFP